MSVQKLIINSIFIFIAFSCLAFLNTNPSYAVIEVTTLADDETDGCGTNECTLREALADVSSGENIDLETSLAGSLPGTITLDDAKGPLVVGINTTLNGPGMGMLTISGGDMVQVLIVNNGITASILRLNITDGDTTSVGGCILNNGTLTINESTISGCNTTQNGGGISNSGTLTIEDSTISGNTTTLNGGGIENFTTGSLNLTNTTISGNTANGAGGGGILNTAGTLNINNSTITDNNTTGNGGGISTGATANIADSIVAGNTANSNSNCDFTGGTFNDLGNNITNDATCPFGSGQNIDPLLGPLADNGGLTQTHALLPGSPAVDNSGTCGLGNDQRGENREVNDCDTGSFEGQKSTITITKSTNPGGETGFDFNSNIPDDACTPTLSSGGFELDDTESIICTATEGSYNVTEVLGAGTTVVISCVTQPAGGVSINNTAGSLDFTLGMAGDDVACLFDNTVVPTGDFTLTVSKAGSGVGTVTGPVGNPDNGGINCGLDCEEEYDDGSDIKLNAVPASGSEFQGFSGDCDEDGDVIINANKSCIATFIPEGGATILNPGDEIELAQLGDTQVEQGGEATIIINARNATSSNLDNVTLTVFEEVMSVSKTDTSVTRFEPTNIILEPNIGTCSELADRVECDIPTLSNDVDLIIDFDAVDVEEGDFDIPLRAESDDLFGLIFEALAQMKVNDGDSGGSGCSISSAGSGSFQSALLLSLIPALIIFRKQIRRRLD